MSKRGKTREEVEKLLAASGLNRRDFRLRANKAGRQGFVYVVFRMKVSKVFVDGKGSEVGNDFEYIAAYADEELGIRARDKERSKSPKGTTVEMMDIEKSKGQSGLIVARTEEEQRSGH